MIIIQNILGGLACIFIITSVISMVRANNKFSKARSNRALNRKQMPGLDVLEFFISSHYTEKGNQYRKQYFDILTRGLLFMLLGIFFLILRLAIEHV